MDIVDEKGRLFGVVNVVDAVAVLLVVAVVAAGASLVLAGPGEPSEPEPERETTVASVTFGTQPDYVAGLVQPGNVTVAGNEGRITDVYRTPGGNGGALVFVRVRVTGQRSDAGFEVGEKVLRHGTKLRFATPSYELTGRVRVAGTSASFDTVSRNVTVRANVSDSVGRAIAAGDVHRIDGTTAATVRGVETVRSGEEFRVVRVRLRVHALDRPTGVHYGGGPLRLGSRLYFETARYEFVGRVVEVAG